MIGAIVQYHNTHAAHDDHDNGEVLAYMYPVYASFFTKNMLDNHRTTEVCIKPVYETALQLEAHDSRVEHATEPRESQA